MPDYDLRVSAGVVESAKRVVTDDPGAKTLLPGALTAQRTWVTTTASSEFPTGGVWRRSGDVRLKSTPRDPGTMLRPYVAYPSVNFSPQTRAEADAEALDLKNALFGSGNDQVGAQVGEPQASRINSQQDVVDTLSFANGGLEANPSPPYALFGASGSLWAPLKNVSLEYGQLFVRVEYQLLNTSGNIAITLEGMKLNASTRHTSAAGMGVRTAEWTVFRNATVDKRINEDRILIQGRNVKVFSVSVRPTPPIAVGNTSYEFVVLDTGVTPQTAALLAARHRYRGKSGALATQLSPSLLASLNQTFWPEVPAWVAASSPTGAAGSFSWQGGGAVDDNAWRAATSFAEPRPLGAHAYTWPSTSGTALGHNGPAVARAGASFGFWVQYATVAP